MKKADGLRADTFYERGMEAKFLRTKIETKGAWGVSHTRVPTESRPGHVAMIAGFYEDVSAVTKGWKDNPVEFDSLFNRSRETWAWGSPDILPMFSSRTDHMTSDCYPAEYEDFGASSAVHLDTWVFDKVRDFFKVRVPSDPELQKRLRQDKIVFFLHLLGIDTIGHAKRPTSKEYIENILAVDKGIEEVVKLIEDFYKDDKTAYVFTADHGMADRGVHGDGDPQNTETPLVVWGAGISKPLFSEQHSSRLVSSSRPNPSNWHLDHLTRRDVTQADIAPLMTTLIGVPVPVNSVGVLPTSYLDVPSDFKADALLDNAKAILLQYLHKEMERRDSSIFFTPFQPLLNHSEQIRGIQKMILNKEYDRASAEAESIIDLVLQGLRYYQIYDKWFLLSIIIAGYAGFMLFTATLVVQLYTSVGRDYMRTLVAEGRAFVKPSAIFIGAALMACMATYLFIERAPASYYFYAIFPFAFWTVNFNFAGMWRTVLREYFGSRSASPMRDIVIVLGSLGVVHVVVYGFHYRQIFAVCFWALAGWGLFIEKRLPSALKIGWSAICLICSIYPLVPVDMGDMTGLLVASGFGAGILGTLLCVFLPSIFNYGLEDFQKQSYGDGITLYDEQLAYSKRHGGGGKTSGNLFGKISNRQALQLLLIFVSTINVYLTEKSLKSNQGLPFINQATSWSVMIFSFIMLIAFPGKHYVDVLTNSFLSLVSPMILLSINFEVLFVTTFFVFAIVWIVIERFIYLASFSERVTSPPANNTSSYVLRSATREAKNLQQKEPNDDGQQQISLQHLRVAAIYILVCFFAFFGTGNLAGFSGFELSSTYRFQTLFDPFMMGALLIVKILLPFILICAVFGVLNRQMNVSQQIASFMLVSILSDSMTLDFLLQVKDSGSWLEIGLSISNFAMLNFFLIFQMILALLTSLLLRKIGTPTQKLKTA